MAKTCPDALTFFLELYNTCTPSSKHLQRDGHLFRNHVPNLSVKPLYETRWECRIDSVKALRYQLPEMCNALDEFAEEADDAIIKNEAGTLYETLKQYKFLVSLVLWYAVIFQVNFVSKKL